MKKKSNWQSILGISAVGICLVCCLSVGLTIRFAPNIYQYFVISTSLKVGDAASDFELQTLDGSVSTLYQVFAIPTKLFVDANGMIRAKIIEKVTPELLAEHLSLIGIDP